MDRSLLRSTKTVGVNPPDNTNRIAVIGRTGSGKSVFASYMLGRLKSGAWANMPITIFDPKRAKLLARMNAQPISVRDKPPTEPGLYIVRPAPVDDDAAVIEYLTRVYEQTHHALYFDETIDLGPKNRGFRRLLTQGRELEIPMLYCTQRPVYCDRYSLSEADYFALFHLRIDDDAKTIRNLVPGYNREALAEYHSYWYDVASDRGTVLAPVPNEDTIIHTMYAPPRPVELDRSKEYLAPVPSRQRVLL